MKTDFATYARQTREKEQGIERLLKSLQRDFWFVLGSFIMLFIGLLGQNFLIILSVGFSFLYYFYWVLFISDNYLSLTWLVTLVILRFFNSLHLMPTNKKEEKVFFYWVNLIFFFFPVLIGLFCLSLIYLFFRF